MLTTSLRAEAPPAKDQAAEPNAVPSPAASPATVAWEKLTGDFKALQETSPDDPAAQKVVAALVSETHDFMTKYPSDPRALNATMLWAQLGDVMIDKQWAGGPTKAEINETFDQLAGDEKVPKPKRAEIRALQLSREMRQAAKNTGDTPAQWDAIEKGLVRFQKEFGADFSFDGRAPAVAMLRNEEISLLASSPDQARYQGLLEKLAADPQPQIAGMAKQRLERERRLAEIKSKPLDIKFAAIDGTEVDLAKLRGKVVLVDFWATWCGPCVGEVPHVVETYHKYHDQGFEIVGVSLDQDKDALLAFTKEHGMVWPQYFDGKGWNNTISRNFGIDSIPAMWLVDKKGMLVTTDGRNDLPGQVEKLLKTP